MHKVSLLTLRITQTSHHYQQYIVPVSTITADREEKGGNRLQ